MTYAAKLSPKFTFLLLPGFSVLSLSCALEPLRVGNRLSGRPLFEWSFISEDGLAVRSSLGVEFPVTGSLAPLSGSETIFVCGGTDIQAVSSRRTQDWLRRQAAHGTPIGGLCTATYTLAKAGLLKGRKATIHWEEHDSFQEEFPSVDLTKMRYVIDGDRYSTAGGTSSMDLLLAIIENRHGSALANLIAQQLIYTTARTAQEGASIGMSDRIGVKNEKLAKVIDIMEDNLESPLTTPALSRRIDVSSRQLERLFVKYLHKSPAKFYLHLRVARAKNLLLQTNMPIMQIALACGFVSPAHFSKCYRLHHGENPGVTRERIRSRDIARSSSDLGSLGAMDALTVSRAREVIDGRANP